MSFRKERKFRLTISDAQIVKAALLNKGMRELYPSRIISSQYFDTKDLKMFDESEEGIVPRKKVRIRWYNNKKINLTLEEKTSSIEGRFKVATKVSNEFYHQALKIGLNNPTYGLLKPTILVQYQREYFEYERIRFTFDQDISYKIFGSRIEIKDKERVMEIKSPFEISDGYLESLFSTPTSRFSKYSRALLNMHKQI